MLRSAVFTAMLAVSALAPFSHAEDAQSPVTVLFLGDQGHHQPQRRFLQIQPVLAARGVELSYTENTRDLNPTTLARYDALLLYANIDRIAEDEARALLDYVATGGGFVPLHCATYCFRNAPEIVALMGGQFQRHGTGVFRTEIAEPNHAVMRGFGGFESWDETYVHHLHNEKDRTVLSYRVDDAGREPWTWVRTHGKGRVFYTAWGHDQRTWGHAGFQNLLERGIRWAAGRDVSVVPDYQADRPFPTPEMTEQRTDVKPFEYVDVGAKIPNYTPGAEWGTQGQPYSKMQKPLGPAESLKHIVVPRGFQVELFAAEPDLGGKPIAMAWDARGRLWVAETYDYPNELQPPGEGRDRIRICQDTDGDQRADKFTVFAEGLSIPTSIAFHRGGAIVQDGVRTLYLKDTDGDDVADERTVLFEGWNQRDTHGGVSNFQYGLDNWIWAMQGYNFSRPTARGEENPGFRQGFFRFRPDGSEIEFIRSTNNNTWGLGISEEGLIFGSTANHNPSVYMPIANRYYEQVRGWTPSLVLGTIADSHLFRPITDKVRQVDQHGGYTAGAGHALYTARRYPPEYWNRAAFVNGPTGHLVGTFVLDRDGADFRSTSPFNLLASDDEWTAPIMAEVGPDGNVWVIDWYNYIVQHNPTPQGFETGKGAAYETDLRDKKHGRIYRVVYDKHGVDPSRSISLHGAKPAQCVAALSHDNLLWRRHAQRLLVERGDLDVLPKLISLASDQSVDAIGLNVGAIHALWTMHGLGALDGSHSPATAAAMAALSHPSAGVRRNALAVLPPTTESTAAVLGADLLGDPDAQVRLAAFLALAELPAIEQGGAAIAAAFNDPANASDRWIPEAATSAAARNDLHFLSAVAGAPKPAEQLLETTRIVAEHYARGGAADSLAALIAATAKAEPRVADTIVGGLAAGWPDEAAVDVSSQLEADLERMFSQLTPGAQGQLVRLATRWGSTRFEEQAREVATALLKQIDDDSLAAAARIGAARQFAEFRGGDADAAADLLEHVTPQLAPEVAAGVVGALALTEAEETAAELIEQFDRLTPSARSAGIVVLMSRPAWTAELLAAADSGHIPLGELSLDQKQALARHPQPRIRRHARQLLQRGGALPDADRQAVLEELLALAAETGDPVAGKEVFKKQCAKCHLHRGEGANIGPDLTGMAVHPKAELLVHLIDPSRNVESNYRVYTVVTIDGRIFTGLLASESRTALELYDAEGKKQSLLREDVDELIATSKSLMPEGFEKQVSAAEITNLLEFLTERGRYVPVDLRSAATITSVRGMFNSKDDRAERLILSDWTPKEFRGVPFHLIDPRDGQVANAILLNGPIGQVSAQMPRRVELPCNMAARAIHLLSGVSGWGHPLGEHGSTSMIVRLHYADGQTEDHELKNGIHFADYIRQVDVPESELAFNLRGRQLRYLAVRPDRDEVIERLELIKGEDRTAPVVMAVTLETYAGETGR